MLIRSREWVYQMEDYPMRKKYRAMKEMHLSGDFFYGVLS
jgi:hypothetical protein